MTVLMNKGSYAAGSSSKHTLKDGMTLHTETKVEMGRSYSKIKGQ